VTEPSTLPSRDDASPSPASRRAEIERRLGERRALVGRLDRDDARVAWARLAVFAGAAAVAWAAWGAEAIHRGWIAAPALLFVALATFHDRLLRRRARAERSVAFHEWSLARVDERWHGRGNPGEQFQAETHPYAADLDLFGKGSLFELLCTARTRAGEERLAAWLLAPAAPAEIAARQAAVRDLAPRLDLREDLAVLGDDVRAGVSPEGLSRWGEAPRLLPVGELWPVAAVLTVVAVALFGGWAAGRIGILPFLGAVLAEWALLRSVRRRLALELGGAERPGRELTVLALLLERLEAERFADERLPELQARLAAGTGRASVSIRRLSSFVNLAEWAHNQFFAPVGFVLLWRLHLGLAIERWRRRHGGEVRRWINAVAELEALGALAAFAWEHPDDTFPEIAPGDGAGAVYQASELGHPLLPSATCVRNDVALGPEARVLLVSGSNMSGESTLLRTVGANAVLALCGAPVRAARLRLTPVALGATLRIQDSLQAGRSRFYAEITRLKALMDLAAGPLPLLFLLDELLSGTNSHDRRIGGEAVVRGLLDRGAIGLLTTHDLALAELAAKLPRVVNAHFEDQVQDGEISFDYRLRPGVVARSNALALMRAVGLEV
jgi:hypothetical protein